MLKKVFIILIIMVAFLLATIYIFRANIKRYAINTILKSFPLPNVAMADVNFDETTGRLKLEEIKVKNPMGFTSKYIMEADAVNMGINFTTKPELSLNINEINITNPAFYLERSPVGKWNFQEYPKKDTTALLEKEKSFDFIKEAFAAEPKKASEVLLPRNININNGAVHFLDNFVAAGKMHRVDFFPVTGSILLNYIPEKHIYEKISFSGSCNIDGNAGRTIKGDFEVYPMEKIPSYMWKVNAYNVPLSTIKPYLDRYTPFIVQQGSFNMSSNVKSLNGKIDGDYTMELMDLAFAINPAKSNIPFMETSVNKLTLYLTNQKGNIVIDFKQKGEAGKEATWSLGPIAKRAIGLMVVDTVIEVINTIEGSGKGEIPNDIPPEVIEIFRGIFK